MVKGRVVVVAWGWYVCAKGLVMVKVKVVVEAVVVVTVLVVARWRS